DREIGADRVKAAVREIDDAAEREDQRQAECDQKVISADQEAVENLLDDEDELHAALLAGEYEPVDQLILVSSPRIARRKTRLNALMLGTHIPEPVIMGPRNGVPATQASRGAPRGDDKI